MNIGQRAIAVLLIVATWSVLFLLFTGIGFIFHRASGLKIRGSKIVFRAFWVGWASVIAFLQLWHLQFRVDWLAFLVVAIFGVVGLLWSRGEIWHFARQGYANKSGFIILTTTVAIVVASRATASPRHFDTYLYGQQSIRWNATYAIVPGLGNLHGRLAFNSSHLLYMALLDIGPWMRKSHHLANGLLFYVLLADMLLSVRKLILTRSRLRLHHALHALLFAPMIFVLFGNTLSSASTDLPVFVLGVVIATELLSYLDNPERSTGEAPSAAYAVVYVAALAATGITIKLSFLVMGAMTALLMFGVLYKRGGISSRLGSAKVFAYCAGAAALTMIPWMIRSVILSGYIAYPNAFGGFPVNWRVPEPAVIDAANHIRGWSRKPYVHWSTVLGNWDWIEVWIDFAFTSPRVFTLVIPVALTLIAAIVGFAFGLKPGQSFRARRAHWLFLVPLLACIAFWFFTAPDPRFAGACLWLLAAGLITLLLADNDRLTTRVLLSITLPLTIVLVAISAQYYDFSVFAINPEQPERFHSAKAIETETVETSDGLVVYVPEAGEQCFGTPLPCSPFPERMPDLKLRKAGDMGSGFRQAFVLAPDEVPSEMHPLPAMLGDGITLLGYIVVQDGQTTTLDQISAGPLNLTLYWQDDGGADDYTIFVHLQDSNGELAAGVDAPPLEGAYPTSVWRKSEVVATSHTLILPPDTGTFSFYTGMYSRPSLERLPAFQNGQRIWDDRIILWEAG